MKYVLFGTPRFAKMCSKGLIAADLVPVALVCNPTVPRAQEDHNSPLTNSSSPKKKTVPRSSATGEIGRWPHLAATRAPAGLFRVPAYAKISPRAVSVSRASAPRHPSIVLPKYRGASPIQSVLLPDRPKPARPFTPWTKKWTTRDLCP